MFLKSLQLFNFRNYETANFEFSEAMNCVLGKNGSGKTNLLDAVYYLALSKSHGQSKDELNIQHQAPFMALHGRFAKSEKEEIPARIFSSRYKDGLYFPLYKNLSFSSG